MSQFKTLDIQNIIKKYKNNLRRVCGKDSKLFLKSGQSKGIESLPQTQDFLITISLVPNVTYLRYFKL